MNEKNAKPSTPSKTPSERTQFNKAQLRDSTFPTYQKPPPPPPTKKK